MENDAVIIAKYDTIEKCVNRILEEYDDNSENLKDYRRTDCIVLNLQRACEAVVDVAMYIVSNRKLGVPQTKKEVFDKLENEKLITKEMANKMKGMVGFRNIAVHDYKEIDVEVLQDVIENHLNDLKEFVRCMINRG